MKHTMGNSPKTVRGKLQVAREVLKLPPADVQLDTKELVAKIKKGISATNADDVYSCGMRDGMRWCMSLVDDEEPLFENCTSAQPEEIGYEQCANAMMKMWIDEVVTDGEYNRIMDKLNKHWRGEQDE